MFSIIKNNHKVEGQLTIDQYVDQVRTQVNGILEYREILKMDKAEADARKSRMTAVTPSGTFVKCRNSDALDEYSGIICIDLDHIDTQGLDIENLKKDLTKDGFVCVVHKSVGGNGLAVLIKLDSGAEMHLSAFFQVADYIQKKYGVKVDQSCKDIARQRYLSYDPDIYYNPQSAAFNVIDPGIFKDILEQIQFTEKIQVMEEGSRNTFLYQLSCNCARAGVPIGQLKQYCIPRYMAKDFPEREMITTIESGYKNVDHEVRHESVHSAHNAHCALPQNAGAAANNNFEDWIFPKLPSFLQGLDQITTNKTQRDIVLISIVGILSASFPNVSSIYRGSRMYSNLYFLIYAPPASDKGLMGIISRLADGLDQMLSEECAQAKREHRAQINVAPVLMDELDEPKCKGLFLDADSSSIAMIQLLDQGKENLLIDTEAVVLSQTRKNDWAQLDPHLRKAYHFERISVSRKDRTITIREPRISVLITGTVEDAKVFSGSIQGGLTSRILPYSFSAAMTWQNQFSDESSKIHSFIGTKSAELIAIFEFNRKYPFELKLTKSQQMKHTDTFGDWTEQLDSGNEFAYLKRLGVATVRLAMILTALRKFDDQNKDSIIYCEDDIFEIALSIADTFRCHGAEFYKLLTQQQSMAQPRVQKVLDNLPKQFETRRFVTGCKQTMQLNERQSKKYLERLLQKGILSQIKQGLYEQV